MKFYALLGVLSIITAQKILVLNANVSGYLQMCDDETCNTKVPGPEVNAYVDSNSTFQSNKIFGCGDICLGAVLEAYQSDSKTSKKLKFVETRQAQQISIVQLSQFNVGNNQTITLSGSIQFNNVQQDQVASDQQFQSPNVGNPLNIDSSFTAIQGEDGNFRITYDQGLTNTIIYLVNQNVDKTYTRLYTAQSDGALPSWPTMGSSTDTLNLKASDVYSKCQFTPPLTFNCLFEIARVQYSKTINQEFFRLQLVVNSLFFTRSQPINIIQTSKLGLVNMKTYQIESSLKLCTDEICAVNMDYDTVSVVQAMQNIYVMHYITDPTLQDLFFYYGMVTVYYDNLIIVGSVQVFESGPGYVVYKTNIDAPSSNLTISVQGVLSNPKSSSRILQSTTQQVRYKLKSNLHLLLTNQCPDQSQSKYCPSITNTNQTYTNTTNQTTINQSITNQNTSNQSTTNQNTTIQTTINQSITNQNTSNQSTANQNTTNQNTTNQNTTNKSTNNQNTTNQSTTTQNTTNQSIINQNTTNQSTTNQNTKNQSTNNPINTNKSNQSNITNQIFISVTVSLTTSKQKKSIKRISKGEKIFLSIIINNKAYKNKTLKQIKVLKGTKLLKPQTTTQVKGKGIINITLIANTSLSLQTLTIKGEFTARAKVSTKVKIPLIK